MEIRFVVERLNVLIDQIRQLEKRFQTLMVDQQKLLQTIPGLGKVPPSSPRSCPSFSPTASTAPVRWLPPQASMCASPKAATRRDPGKMSKRGSRYLRTAVMQAAEIAVFRSHDPLFSEVYKRQKDRGKHHMVALTHVANKMLHVIFSVLKNDRAYTPILT